MRRMGEWSGYLIGGLVALVAWYAAIVLLERRVERRFWQEVARHPFPHGDGVPRVTEELLRDVPAPVREWIRRSGAVGRPLVTGTRSVSDARVRVSASRPWKETRADVVRHYWPRVSTWQLLTVPRGPITSRYLHILRAGEEGLRASTAGSTASAIGTAVLEKTLTQTQFANTWLYSPAALALLPVTWEEPGDGGVASTLRRGGVSARVVGRFDADGDPARMDLDLPTSRGGAGGPTAWLFSDWFETGGRRVTRRMEMQQLQDGEYVTTQEATLREVEFHPHPPATQ